MTKKLGQQCLEIYNTYPKKKARAVALKAIAKALRQVNFGELLKLTKNFAQRMEEHRGTDRWQFVPYPATWFNAESYADEPDPAPKDFTEHGNSPREPETESEWRMRTITPEQWLAFNTYTQGASPAEIETLIDEALANMSVSDRSSAASCRDLVGNSILRAAAFGVWEQRCDE